MKVARNAIGASLTLAALSLAAVSLSHMKPVGAQSGPPANSPEFYTQQVQPIFQANCYRCHGGMNRRGGLQLDTQAGMMRGGKDGSVITPGHPEQSLLIALIRHEGPADDPMPMPPRSKISDADIATVTAWIKAGAVMPPDAK